MNPYSVELRRHSLPGGKLKAKLFFAPRAVRALTLLFVCFALPACGGGGGGAAGSAGDSTPARQPKATVTLGYLPNVTHATAIAGIETGIFARDLGPGVEFKTATFNAGPAAVEALFSQAVDATYIGPNPALNAYIQSKGEAVRIISGATSGGAFLVVRPEVNSAQDLRGKKVASPQLGNTQDIALRSWLKSKGLKSDAQGGGDVSVVPQENSQTVNTFRGGQIAGAWVPEPWATILQQEAGGKVLVDERDLWPGGRYATTVLLVRTAFLKQHPDLVQKLLQAQLDANTFVNAHPEDAQHAVATALQRITGKAVNGQELATSWKNLEFTNDPVAPSLKQAATAAASLGFLNLNGVDVNGIYSLDAVDSLL
jgi:NitT/TauT family transport system substrate-binding protein